VFVFSGHFELMRALHFFVLFKLLSSKSCNKYHEETVSNDPLLMLLSPCEGLGSLVQLILLLALVITQEKLLHAISASALFRLHSFMRYCNSTLLAAEAEKNTVNDLLVLLQCRTRGGLGAVYM
jgi:hypothetical protein